MSAHPQDMQQRSKLQRGKQQRCDAGRCADACARMPGAIDASRCNCACQTQSMLAVASPLPSDAALLSATAQPELVTMSAASHPLSHGTDSRLTPSTDAVASASATATRSQ
jgi:hypothetical protein